MRLSASDAGSEELNSVAVPSLSLILCALSSHWRYKRGPSGPVALLRLGCWEVRTAGSASAKQKGARKSPLLNPLRCRLNLESNLGSQLNSARPTTELCFVQEAVTNIVDVRISSAQRVVDGVDK